ncbi:Hypothetical predicted protein [Pelobates cultripes]|uniref:Uncharacterized protein n=1 Tax=Pelobates cultripes TaxID=61616 RepID=A0AAD1RQY7_PELCU|nr:Hypothetical predicted protein [Pelobates cultripes]
MIFAPPQLTEWEPPGHIAQYIAHCMRSPLSNEERSKLHMECPWPSVPGSACKTPEVDPQIAQFPNKSCWKRNKGLDFSLESCQDKIMDTLRPLSKVYELLDSAKAGELELDLEVAIGWVQRAICLLCNANMAISAKCPKLVNMAISEPGPATEGMLFGDSFTKDLGSYLKTFTVIDKAQANIKRVFSPNVFGGARRNRSCPPGRAFQDLFRAT